MAFQVSPGVNVTEKDLTNIVPAVSTSSAESLLQQKKDRLMRLLLFHLKEN